MPRGRLIIPKSPLLPEKCPCCAFHAPTLITMQGKVANRYAVTCPKCGLSTCLIRHLTPEAAVAAWNQREKKYQVEAVVEVGERIEPSDHQLNDETLEEPK